MPNGMVMLVPVAAAAAIPETEAVPPGPGWLSVG